MEQSNPIPQNSATLLIDESTSRFNGADWFEKMQTVPLVLAGLGGIGSYTALMLARTKPLSISIFDSDIVEEGNLSGQLYSDNQVGMSKARATSDNCRKFGAYRRLYVYDRNYDNISITSNVMICGFDNMAARRIFFEAWKTRVNSHNPEDRVNCLFIDGRLAMEEFQVLAITGDNVAAIEKYESEWLFEDSEAEAHICSRKQTAFTANMIGSVIVNIFVNFVANMCNPIVPRDVPFLTRYDASLMYFKTESV